MTSASKRKLALRGVKTKSHARAMRKVFDFPLDEEIMSTPEGHFIFGREWTPEDMAMMGNLPNAALKLNRIISAPYIEDGASDRVMSHREACDMISGRNVLLTDPNA